jgi:8-oxo-dGTP diphosphatase
LEDFSEKFSKLVSLECKMVQLRIENFSSTQHSEYVRVAKALSKSNFQLQINTSVNEFVKMDSCVGVGLHLNSHYLMQLQSRPIDNTLLLGASCHSLAELEQAKNIQADYVFLSPIKQTTSHPDAQVLGWNQFQQFVEQINIPVYALGGLSEVDLMPAIHLGAQGIASISTWWQ